MGDIGLFDEFSCPACSKPIVVRKSELVRAGWTHSQASWHVAEIKMADSGGARSELDAEGLHDAEQRGEPGIAGR